MQRLLVPTEHPQFPHFQVDAAYLPAKEVGGDFYQCLPGDDGSLLVVVGDVSGKGLDAAMLAATVIGGLGTVVTRNPGEVLGNLNHAVLGKTRGGFITCCCALFHPAVTVEIANAGHIPPYLDGQEVEVDAGPPLGIIPDASYETTTIETNRTLTFLSDGVLEATNAKGEMLGFDRMAALTAKSAGEIAAEAKAWGQEDDITVVRVEYA